MINTINLLFGLHEYVLLSGALKKMIETSYEYEVATSISLCYDTITLKVDSITETIGNRGVLQPGALLKCSFQIKDNLVTLNEIHCPESTLRNEIKEFISHHFSERGMTWKIGVGELLYSTETVRYLAIADNLAKEAYLCASGDNYRPGYFSEIILAHEAFIILKQINRHNSRSIDHKKDYYMRDLEFLIPLKSFSKELSFDEETIGEMCIRFHDHSTQNNQKSGDRIRERIVAQKSNF